MHKHPDYPAPAMTGLSYAASAKEEASPTRIPQNQRPEIEDENEDDE